MIPAVPPQSCHRPRWISSLQIWSWSWSWSSQSRAMFMLDPPGLPLDLALYLLLWLYLPVHLLRPPSSHLLQPQSHSAEKDEDAIAQCLVASRGWGAQIVAFLSFLSTHSDANTKFKFNFFSSIEIEIRNFDIKSMTLDSSNQPWSLFPGECERLWD